MPAKFRVKDYQSKSYYHIFNRGIDGRVVFEQESDFRYFEKLMEQYLVGPVIDPRRNVSPSRFKYLQRMALKNEVELVAYCLMPDHFHLLVYQEPKDGIVRFMRRLMTGYVMYFNRRKSRSGPLFETNYRAVRVDEMQQVVTLAKFIHLNPVNRVVKRFGPVETVTGTNPSDYQYSSYSSYIGIKECLWVKKLSGVGEAGDVMFKSDRVRNSDFDLIKTLTIDA